VSSIFDSRPGCTIANNAGEAETAFKVISGYCSEWDNTNSVCPHFDIKYSFLVYSNSHVRGYRL
jgi:hypothetical protein